MVCQGFPQGKGLWYVGPGARTVGGYQTVLRNHDEGGDYQAPQREAAFFFGLFLRGHSAEELRQDIDFPPELLAKWRRHPDPNVRSSEDLQRIFEYRKRVLAIFNFLVNSENGHLM